VRCEQERSLLAINYTEGTPAAQGRDARPVGEANLQALAAVLHAGRRSSSVNPWTPPMFQCDGWCFASAVTATGATHVCLRSVDTARI